MDSAVVAVYRTTFPVDAPPGEGVGGAHRLRSSAGPLLGRRGLGVVLADELRRLEPSFVPGFLNDRRDLWVGEEAL